MQRVTAAGLMLLVGLGAAAWAAEPPEQFPRTDSRAPYVHRITLYDHDGAAIDPDDALAGPYSPRMTCGKCHDYVAISHGWHFNAASGEVSAGRPGEPWILLDSRTADALPVSGRGWPATLTPQQAGLTDWQFVLRFGHHLPGGGYGEPDDSRVAGAPERDRWRISGRLEIDCMFCHSADQQHDPAEAARQIEQQNFRWAPTAALGLAMVRGAAKDLPDDWDPLMPPNPNYPEQAGPRLVWDKSRFDPDDRVLFNIVRKPPSERCYFCHSFREVGQPAKPAWQISQDVHTAAKLACVECHRNGIDHMITRGYPGEAKDRAAPAAAAFSCEGCHLGVDGASDPELALGGHLAAPHPQHRGLPPLHFEKLACTACHSGPRPQTHPRRFQTALAHGLGLASRDRKDDLPPVIVGPVFLRQRDGRIAPHRLLWQVRPGGTGLGTQEHPLPQPCAWPIAHDVRPAAQSLGAGGCQDCHARDAPIYFGCVTTQDRLPEAPAARLMYELRGDSRALATAWALGFLVRPAFKWFGLACAAAIFLTLVRGLLLCQVRIPAANPQVSCSEARGAWRLSLVGRLALGIGLVGLIGCAVTGFGAAWIQGEVRGWPLFAHMLAAPLFLAGLTGCALTWGWAGHFGLAQSPTAGRLDPAQRLLLWPVILLGWLTILPMLAAMLPIFGYADQELLTDVHEYGAAGLVIGVAALALCSWRSRGARR